MTERIPGRNHDTNVQTCHCLRPLRLALLASSPKGGAKGRLIAARLFFQRKNNVGALRRQCGIEHFTMEFGCIVSKHGILATLEPRWVCDGSAQKFVTVAGG